MITVEGYRAVGSLNDSFQSSNFLLLVFFIADVKMYGDERSDGQTGRSEQIRYPRIQLLR